jgi:DNA-binding PadR family transcriptional regulator
MSARRKPSGDRSTGRFFGRGELRLALLALIAERPGHGYELMIRLEERFAGAYQASAGAIYPTLQQLEDEELARLEVNDGRKVYHITEAGRQEVDAHTREAEEIWARAARRGDWGALGDPNAAEILGPALRLMKAAVKTIVKTHGNPDMVDDIRTVLDNARHEIERLARRRRP